MLYANDVFSLDGIRYRFLATDPSGLKAWCIDLHDTLAWPVEMAFKDIYELQREADVSTSHFAVSAKRKLKCDASYVRLKKLIESAGTSLFEPTGRDRAVKEFAAAVKCSPQTLRKHLRQFWCRGQTKLALLPDYHKSGRSTDEQQQLGRTEATGGRGRRASRGTATYQMCRQDAGWFRQVIEETYLKDDRQTMKDAYVSLIERHYQFEDGNQKRFLNPPGERPSLRQFIYFLKGNYDLEARLRSRKGNSDYERDHRKKLGTVLDDCLGVGHYYEIDSTIGDIYLVSRQDVTKIIGKPTIYLIIDRKSRLIVGFYFGLENASWVGAMQAILSLSEDKRNLCRRYGVEYVESDWPADRIFPATFLADRGDMISSASSSIVEELHSTIANLPSKRPDHKPLVECGFRQLHNTLRPTAPAYDPPANATRRQGKRYDKDACLTIDDFGNLMLNAIIHHNRRAILGYDLTPNELMDEVRPTPIELWNHGVRTRAGQIRSYEYSYVRQALLPRAKGVVTEHGIEFKGLFYTCSEAIQRKWFEHARVKRFTVEVLFDPRLVDTILVRRNDGDAELLQATLTPRSQQYSAMSFDEVAYYAKLKATVNHDNAEARLQNTLHFRASTQPTISEAKKQLKRLGKTPSRSHRRADTKAERTKERALERNESASLATASSSPPPLTPKVPEQRLTVVPPIEQSQSSADRMVEARRRILEGW